MKYITTSLLSSFKYWKELEKPLDEFLDTLNKVRTPPSEAMQRGISFENDVKRHSTALVILEETSYLEDIYPIETCALVERISNTVRGGLWQQPVKKSITVNGQEFMLYGKADVIKGNTIYDIKTTKVYTLGKYNTSTQHLIYMYCTGIENFEYLIAQGGVNLENFYKESYQMKSDCEIKIKEKIVEFLAFLDNCDKAKKAYSNNWEFIN